MTDAVQTRATVSAEQSKTGHGAYVDIVNAMLDARNQHAAQNNLHEFNLKAAFKVLLTLGLDQATVLEAMHDADPHVKDHDGAIDAARSNYCDDECEIDDKPLLSIADDGVWVSAWVWVYTGDMEDGET